MRYHLSRDGKVDDIHSIAASLCRNARKKAKERGYKVDRSFTPKKVAAEIERQGRCWLSGREFNYERNHPDRPSPDRLDPEGNYEFSNVRFVCSEINQARRKMSISDFVSMCVDVADHAGNQQQQEGPLELTRRRWTVPPGAEE